MSREEYQIDGVNISVIANQRKKEIGVFNTNKAKDKLKNSNIEYKEVPGGIKFNIDEVKYSFWGKKNRVYEGINDTGLTIVKFLKEKKIDIEKGNNKCNFVSIVYKMKFGKYKGWTIKQIMEDEYGYNYIKWLINSDIIYEYDRKKINEILKYKYNLNWSIRD